MFRLYARKYTPVLVPVIGVLCIGKYLQEERNYQTRYYQSPSRICPMTNNSKGKETEEEYHKNIMYNYFFH